LSTPALAPSSICFLLTSMSFAGAEIQVLNLATEFRRRGWEVRVVSMLPPEDLVDRLRAADIEYHTLGMRRGVPDPRMVFRLAALLRRWQPRVLHCHMVHANLLGRLVRLLAPVPVLVSTAHSINEGGRLRELFYRVTDPLTDVTTHISEVAAEHYVKVGAVPPGRIRFIPNGLDLGDFRPDPEGRRVMRRQLQLQDGFIWLAVGRFDEAKDYPTMLRAFARAVNGRKVVLLLVGGDGLEERMTPLVKELGIDRRVRFLGTRDDVQMLMKAADAYLMSSAWEGMPMVLLEAAASGLPIVSTDVGGIGEVVQDGVNGFLVEAREPDRLAGAIGRLMELSADERERMGREGRRLVEGRFGLSAVVDQWEALYAELGEQKRK